MDTASARCRHACRLGLIAIAAVLANAGTPLAREAPAPGKPDAIADSQQSDPGGAAAVARIRSLYETDTTIDETDPASVSAWFSPDLATEITRLHNASGSYGVGFDYLVDGQDSELSEITYAFYEAGSGGRPGVRVRFTNFNTPVDLDFRFDDTKTPWLITNIHSLRPDGTEKWNLRDTVVTEYQGLR